MTNDFYKEPENIALLKLKHEKYNSLRLSRLICALMHGHVYTQTSIDLRYHEFFVFRCLICNKRHILKRNAPSKTLRKYLRRTIFDTSE